MKFGLGLFLWVFWMEQGMKKGVVCIFFLVGLCGFKLIHVQESNKSPLNLCGKTTIDFVMNPEITGCTWTEILVHGWFESQLLQNFLLHLNGFKEILYAKKLEQTKPVAKAGQHLLTWNSSSLCFFTVWQQQKQLKKEECHHCFMPALLWLLCMRFAQRSCVSTGRNWCDCSSSLPSLL